MITPRESGPLPVGAIVGIVPAAGRGSRFAKSGPGTPPKLLTLIDGLPMVRRTVASLLDGGASRCVVVVSAQLEVAVHSALAGLPVTLAVNPEPDQGMFSSIQCGVAHTAEGDVCLLLPGDMPYVQPATVAAVLASAARTGLTVSAAHAGRNGHPIVLSAALRSRILQAPPNAILSEERSREQFLSIDVPDAGVHRDVDRPSDVMP